MPKRPRATDIFSNWHTSIQNFQASPKDFYEQVELALQKHQIPGIKGSRVNWAEGGLFSGKREYLRIQRKEFVFDICGAPFGNGFFFSWWLGELLSFFWTLVSMVPFLGTLMISWFRPQTYYRRDTAQMFQDLVHTVVLEVIDNMTSTKGLPPLPAQERQPIIRRLGP